MRVNVNLLIIELNVTLYLMLSQLNERCLIMIVLHIHIKYLLY
jgi:hypothetical protein